MPGMRSAKNDVSVMFTRVPSFGPSPDAPVNLCIVPQEKLTTLPEGSETLIRLSSVATVYGS